MEASYSHLRQNLKKVIDESVSSHEPTFITSHNKRKAVLISYEDYQSLEETAYLLRSPANAGRLLNAVTTFHDNPNQFEQHNLIEDEE